jgi:hypothetical protein
MCWVKSIGRVALVSVSLLIHFEAQAQSSDPLSANWIMPGCRAWLASNSDREPVTSRICAGKIVGVRGTMQRLNVICVPSRATIDQTIRIVVQYIEARPAMHHLQFHDLAFDALRATWPCR